MTASRAAFFVLLFAVAAYANSVGNGFAYDDDGIITNNPVVTEGRWQEAVGGSWWPTPLEGSGLYRPLTSLSFVAEWRLFGGDPAGFHALNVLFHALNSLLVFVLLLSFAPTGAAAAGAVIFAVHPLHTEAVANVVGRAELYAAFFYLSACLLYWRGREWRGGRRVLRLLALAVLYLLSLAGKEIGVTLPAALLVLEAMAPHSRPEGEPRLARRLAGEAATFLLLGVVLAAYLGLRFLVLGSVSGELPAPVFQVVGPAARVMTAVGLWAQYLRLLLFPLDLSVDYDPGVLFPSEVPDLPFLLGALSMAGLALAALRARRPLPLVTVGIAWFAVAVLPVSNLFFSTGVLLAERTLYLPSAGLAIAVAGLAEPVLGWEPGRRRVAVGAVLLAVLALFVRTVVRNPSWMSGFVVHQTLNEEHPESWRAFRARAQGLERTGQVEEAARAWDTAVLLAPMDYTLLVQAGDFHCRLGSWERGEAYLRKAIALHPDLANAYQLLAAHMINRGWGREGHRIALEGLRHTGSDRELWALVSESYILKGDLEAAVRAREAAIGADPASAFQWHRLGEILREMGDTARAGAAFARAEELEGVAAPEGEG